MMSFFRLLATGFLVVSAIYGLLVIAERLRIRRRLRADWHRAGKPGDLREFTRRGMADYARSFRRKLLLAVYVIPMVTVLVIIYVVNFM